MKVIPAIDLISGECVRLTKGDYDTKIVYDKNPVEMVKRFVDKGFDRVHVVDLDGAKAGYPVNAPTIERMAKVDGVKLDVGGGIKTESSLKNLFSIGVDLVTIGSLAVQQPEELGNWIDFYGASHFILGADIKGEHIATNGWLTTSEMTLNAFIEHYFSLGIRQFLCTDISRDGMLQGPAVDLYANLLNRFPDIYLIASGGVSNYNDLVDLKNKNVPAVVVGKAYYEGRITLEEMGNNLIL
jgi:phosphoribosylformimino-5-aminoimidazole carboxamide ribotide isomerase